MFKLIPNASDTDVPNAGAMENPSDDIREGASRGEKGKPEFSMASLSLGTNLYHTLRRRIAVASEMGYDGIEIFIPDFEAFVMQAGVGMHRDLFARYSSPDSLEMQCARVIGDLYFDSGLKPPCLGAFPQL